MVARVLPLPNLLPILAASLSLPPNLVSGLGQTHQEEDSADICTDYFYVDENLLQCLCLVAYLQIC